MKHLLFDDWKRTAHQPFRVAASRFRLATIPDKLTDGRQLICQVLILRMRRILSE
jgi:hypothetical protein